MDHDSMGNSADLLETRSILQAAAAENAALKHRIADLESKANHMEKVVVQGTEHEINESIRLFKRATARAVVKIREKNDAEIAARDRRIAELERMTRPATMTRAHVQADADAFAALLEDFANHRISDDAFEAALEL
jgi:hypothetical protein